MGLPPTSPEDAARGWRSQLPRSNRRLSNLRGSLVFGFSAALYALTWVGMVWPENIWIRLLACAVNPIVMGGLFVIGHDAAHGTLAASRWLNGLLGRLAMLPAWHPFTSWSHAHNRGHHGGTNFKGRDPAFPPFTKAEYDALPLWRRLLERFYRSAPGIGFFYTGDFWLKRLVFPRGSDYPPERRAFQLDRLLILAFLIAQSCAIYAFGVRLHGEGLRPLLFTAWTVVVPWLLWIWFMGFVSYLQHTHPCVAWYDDADEWSFYHVQLRSTVHITFPLANTMIDRIMHNIFDHTAHHIDPTIPLTALPESQRDLEQKVPQYVVVSHWTPLDYLRTTAACKLYDYANHRWLDFDGNPTTGSGLAGLPPLVRAHERERVAAS